MYKLTIVAGPNVGASYALKEGETSHRKANWKRYCFKFLTGF